MEHKTSTKPEHPVFIFDKAYLPNGVVAVQAPVSSNPAPVPGKTVPVVTRPPSIFYALAAWGSSFFIAGHLKFGGKPTTDIKPGGTTSTEARTRPVARIAQQCPELWTLLVYVVRLFASNRNSH